MTLNRWAILLGAVAGVIFTRTPYMADGNLLITTVCVIISTGITFLVWVLIKKLFKS
jgi:drug/metabolite transporter (DMT)-like permease